jgi:hypothetical protein
MPDSKTKRTYDQDTLAIPGLRLEPTDPARPNPKSGNKRSSRYDELEKPEREKLVNKLIDRLKGL